MHRSQYQVHTRKTKTNIQKPKTKKAKSKARGGVTAGSGSGERLSKPRANKSAEGLVSLADTAAGGPISPKVWEHLKHRSANGRETWGDSYYSVVLRRLFARGEQKREQEAEEKRRKMLEDMRLTGVGVDEDEDEEVVRCYEMLSAGVAGDGGTH